MKSIKTVIYSLSVGALLMGFAACSSAKKTPPPVTASAPVAPAAQAPAPAPVAENPTNLGATSSGRGI